MLKLSLQSLRDDSEKLNKSDSRGKTVLSLTDGVGGIPERGRKKKMSHYSFSGMHSKHCRHESAHHVTVGPRGAASSSHGLCRRQHRAQRAFTLRTTSFSFRVDVIVRKT